MISKLLFIDFQNEDKPSTSHKSRLIKRKKRKKSTKFTKKSQEQTEEEWETQSETENPNGKLLLI